MVNVGSMRAESQEGKGGTADPARLRIAEIYASLQGEGKWAGSPSIFLRVSGCNLRCWFCDTPFASWHPEGETLTVDETLQRTLSFTENDVVLTGGEPLIFTAIAPITHHLRRAGRRITIETAGTVDQDFTCDLLSISPKLASSAPDAAQHGTWNKTHNQRRHRPDLIGKWLKQFRCQLKFVVSDARDCQEVLDYLQLLPRSHRNTCGSCPRAPTRSP